VDGPGGKDLPPRGLTTATSGVAVATTVATTTSVTAAATTGVATARSAAEAAAAAEVATAAGGTAEATAIASAAAAAATTSAELTEVTVGTLATTTTGAATTATATAKGALAGNGLQEAGNLLVGLLEKVNQLADNTTVATVEESSGVTSVSGTTSTTDTVNVVVNVGGQIVVDNVCDVGNIETTSGNSGGNKNGATSVAEHLESTLTLALGTISVNGGGGEVLVDEEIRQRVGHSLGLDEN
jgi:hypothetical protein